MQEHGQEQHSPRQRRAARHEQGQATALDNHQRHGYNTHIPQADRVMFPPSPGAGYPPRQVVPPQTAQGADHAGQGGQPHPASRGAAPRFNRPPKPAPKHRSSELTPLSPRMWFAVAVVLLLAVGSFVGIHLMNKYIEDQQTARERAYQQVLARHPMSFQPLIEQYAQEYNLHPAFVSAIIMNESSFRTDAESNAGARGLMQLMPDTADWIAGKLGMTGFSFERMYDAESNIRFGTWYLNYLAKLFQGDPVAVACGYHAGQGQVQRWLSDTAIAPDGRTIMLDNLKDGPTKTYARRVTQAYGIYETIYYPPTDTLPDDGTDVDSAAHPDGTGV